MKVYLRTCWSNVAPAPEAVATIFGMGIIWDKRIKISNHSIVAVLEILNGADWALEHSKLAPHPTDPLLVAPIIEVRSRSVNLPEGRFLSRCRGPFEI